MVKDSTISNSGGTCARELRYCAGWRAVAFTSVLPVQWCGVLAKCRDFVFHHQSKVSVRSAKIEMEKTRDVTRCLTKARTCTVEGPVFPDGTTNSRKWLQDRCAGLFALVCIESDTSLRLCGAGDLHPFTTGRTSGWSQLQASPGPSTATVPTAWQLPALTKQLKHKIRFE